VQRRQSKNRFVFLFRATTLQTGLRAFFGKKRTARIPFEIRAVFKLRLPPVKAVGISRALR